MQVNLFCRDVERTLAFFVALGLPEAFRAPHEGQVEHAEVQAGSARIGLTSIEALRRHTGLEATSGTTASSEVVLWCDSVDDWHARALAAGATNLRDPAVSPDGRLRFSWAQDPEGHQVKLVEKA